MQAVLCVSDCLCRSLDRTHLYQRITPEQHPHNFVKIIDPQALIIKQNHREQHPARCDGCQKKIIGTRYKVRYSSPSVTAIHLDLLIQCMTCPDYDLCDKCEAHPIPFHPPAHHMLKMRTSSVPPPSRSGQFSAAPVQLVPPPSPAQVEVTTPLNTLSPVTPPPPPTVVRVAAGSLIPDLNVLVEEPASFPTPTMKAVDAPPADVPGLNFSDKESVIPGTFVPDEEPFFRNLDLERELGDLNFERDFGQWFNPESYAKSDTAVAPPPIPTEPKVIGDVEPVPESQVALSSPVMSEKAVQPVSSPVPEPPLRATFISDNNISDGHLLPPGAEFVKSWKMLNDGVRDWPENTQLIFVAGDKLVSEENTMVKVGKVAAGEETDIWTGDMKVCPLFSDSKLGCSLAIGS